jgi:4-hydroxybenzoate polyprenyltransferase
MRKLVGFLKLFRINRTIMVAAITGTGACASGASGRLSLLMTLAGFLLATGGFSLDFVADRHLDITGPRAQHRFNPVAEGTITPAFGTIFSLVFILASFVLILLISPFSLIPWVVTVSVIAGLALHKFEGAISRAFTLGLLQGLYTLMGGLSGRLTPGVLLLSAMFFFAMFGGRAVTDIRDFLQDKNTPVETFPKQYGTKAAVVFASVCISAALAISLLIYITGEFNRMYLYFDMGFVGLGILLVALLAIKPTPAMAQFLTYAFMMGAGSVICIAVILGKMAIR